MDLTIELIYINPTTVDVIVNLTNNQFTNQPPEDPTEPEGIDQGITEFEYQFTTTATDPDGHQLYYMWDWDDGQMSDWLGPFNSGEVADASHSWTEAGMRHISVKVKDEYDEESDWSETTNVLLAVAGDANGSGICDVADAVYVINYVFKDAPPPYPLVSGDANCDDIVNVADAVWIIQYVFKDGPPPGCSQ